MTKEQLNKAWIFYGPEEPIAVSHNEAVRLCKIHKEYGCSMARNLAVMNIGGIVEVKRPKLVPRPNWKKRSKRSVRLAFLMNEKYGSLGVFINDNVALKGCL